MNNDSNFSVLICPVCGGTELQSNGNGTYKCRSCNAVLRDDAFSARLASDVQMLFGFLSASKFEAAEESCRNKLTYAPDSAELHWLLFLAKNKIKFVVDPQTKERKPVFYSNEIFTRDCVLDDEDFIASLRGDNADQYRETGQKIEDVRCELCENMVKNPDFEKVDVFISFKSTEKLTDADGNEKEVPTEDSVIASQVYEALTKLGYRVFFSPVSIGKGKIEGEKYEPKIFAALAGCKAMVLVGTKSGYLNSTWVRNEWSRYIYFMEHCHVGGKTTIGKEQGTLFYMYGNSIPRGLPSQIAERQGISCGTNNPKYIEILCEQIREKIVPAERKIRVSVAPTKNVRGKAKTINDGVVKRTVAIAEASSLTLDDDRKLKAAKAALGGGDYIAAEKYAFEVLTEKPHNGNALIVNLLAKCKVQNVDELADNQLLTEDYDLLCDNILYGVPDTVAKLVQFLAQRMENAVLKDYDYDFVCKWLELPKIHEFEGRKKMFDVVLNAAYKVGFTVGGRKIGSHLAMCDNLLSCFDQEDVDGYIDACKRFAQQMVESDLFEPAKNMYVKASDADPDDPETKWMILWCDCRYVMLGDALCDVEVFTPEAMEQILRCCVTAEDQFDYIQKAVCEVLKNDREVVKLNVVDGIVDAKQIRQRREVIKNQLTLSAKILDGIVQYVDKVNDEWIAFKLFGFADICRQGGEFDLAETYYKRALKLGYCTAEVYWGLLLAELKCKNNNRLNDVDTPVDAVENGNLYANVLAAASNDGTINKYIRAKKQQADAIRIRNEKTDLANSKRKKKVTLISVIAVVLVLVAISTVFLVYYFSQSQVVYTLVDGGYVASAGKFFNPTEEVEIADEYKGLPVVGIASNGFCGKNMRSISLPDTVTYIGDSAFNDCTQLSDINIPDSVTVIGENAFAGCKSLEKILLPMSNIGDKAFYGCTSLSDITVITYDKDFDVKQFASFWGLSEDTNMTLVGRVIYGEKQLLAEWNKSFSLPIVEKPGYSFVGYYDSENDGNAVTDDKGDSLVPFDFEEQVTLYARMKANVNKLYFDENGGVSTDDAVTELDVATDEKITLPKCGFLYDGYVFVGWNTDPTVQIVEYNDEGEFVMFPAQTTLYAVWKAMFSVTAVEGGCRIDGFSDGIFAENITIPEKINGNSVVEIGDDAFAKQLQIVSATLPSSVKTIGEGAFRYCVELSEVTIPQQGLTTIKTNAFGGCINLTSVLLPETMSDLQEKAFFGCYRLAEVIDKKGLSKEVVFNAYYNYEPIVVHGGESLISVQDNFKFITVENKNYLVDMLGTGNDLIAVAFKQGFDPDAEYGEEYKSFAGTVLFEILNFQGMEVVLPDNFNGQSYEIAPYAFACSKLDKVVVNDGVTAVGTGAFSECYCLEEVKLPDSLKKIDKEAFAKCLKMTSFVVPSGVDSWGVGAFTGCFRLAEIIDKSGSIGYGVKSNITMQKVLVHKGETKIKKIGNFKFIAIDGENLLVDYSGSDKDVVFPANEAVDNYSIATYGDSDCDWDINDVDPSSPNYLPCGDDGKNVYFNYKVRAYAFFSCDIDSVKLSQGVTEVEPNAFTGCLKLKTLTLGIKDATSSDLPFNTLKQIGEYAFANTSLANIYFQGSLKDWEKIALDNFWIDPYAQIVLHAFDGETKLFGDSYN